MSRYLIEIDSMSKEFDSVEAMKEFKELLKRVGLTYREYDLSLCDSIGLRGIEGVRYCKQNDKISA